MKRKYLSPTTECTYYKCERMIAASTGSRITKDSNSLSESNENSIGGGWDNIWK